MLVTEHFRGAGLHEYAGLSIQEDEMDRLAQLVKTRLDDQPTTDEAVEELLSLERAGFSSEGLRSVIEIEETENHYPIWKIGEVLAEILIEENCDGTFPFSRISTLTNLRSSPAGADLLGIVHNNGWKFLLGETKTSQERAYPPQIVDSRQATCLTKQIIDMAKNKNKRKLHIRFLSIEFSRVGQRHADFDKFVEATKAYIADSSAYKIFGIVIRDTEPNQADTDSTHTKIEAEADCTSIAVYLSALYSPISLNDLRLRVLG